MDGRCKGPQVVDAIQAFLEQLYDTHVGLRVSDYLIDEATRQTLPGAQMQLPEQLFVRGASEVLAATQAGCAAAAAAASHAQDGRLWEADDADMVEVALYLDADLLAQLAHDNPLARLHRGNLEAFCIVAEGISHFVFLAWRLSHGLDVTALELELQAEVDKFCLCSLLCAAQPPSLGELDAASLWRQLFVAYELQPGLSAEEHHRYRTASRAAARIARSMLPVSCNHVRPDTVVRQARQWCRRSLADKMRAYA